MPGEVSIASTLVLYSFVIAAGIYIGKVKFFGVSLGVTFVLFVGILMGHFGYVVDNNILKFVREFGLILFIFSIGLQVGPGFFSSFKKGGMRLNLLAVLGITLNVAIVLCIYFFGNVHDISALVGVMSGAVTNTRPRSGTADYHTDDFHSRAGKPHGKRIRSRISPRSGRHHPVDVRHQMDFPHRH